MSAVPEWTEGICDDGAAILRDGVMVPVEAEAGDELFAPGQDPFRTPVTA